MPRFGPELRAIASEGVRKVYNHGAGADRERYENEREALAGRFRAKFGSEGTGADGEAQGNVQPDFVGVFDTVAALGSRTATTIAVAGLLVLLAATAWIGSLAPWWMAGLFALLPLAAFYWAAKSFWSQVKTFADDAALAQPWWHHRRWFYQLRHTHLAWWSGKHYDRYVDREVGFLRHALAIDEDRARFPRVAWGRPVDVRWHEDRGRKDWLVQPWFAGNHSDIGGSYPEEESRLSDIALRWMVDELKGAMGDSVTVLEDRLVTSPDPLGLQHSERIGMLNAQPGLLRFLTRGNLVWRYRSRDIHPEAQLHPSVLERLAAPHVPQMGEVRAYRPESLRGHREAKALYPRVDARMGGMAGTDTGSEPTTPG